MKKLFLAVVAFFFMCGMTQAMDISIAWDANTESNLAGYKVHYDTDQSGPPYANEIDVGNVITFDMPTLADDVTCWIVVTAYNDMGLESGYSNEVVASLAPANPTGLITTAIEKIIAALQDIKTALVAQVK